MSEPEPELQSIFLEPCPYGSFLDRQDHGPDIIARPMAFRGKSGNLLFSRCQHGCPLCAQMPNVWTDTVENLRESWELSRTNFEAAKLAAPRCEETMRRLEKRYSIKSNTPKNSC